MPLRRLGPVSPLPDPDAILREQPFAEIALLSQVEPLAGEEAHSGRAFLAIADDGRRFKLRVCADRWKARRTARRLRRLAHVFPRLQARRGRYLLLEFLEGERVDDRKELRPHAELLGRICAEIHRMGEPRDARGRARLAWEALRLRAQFRRQLRALARAGVLDAELARGVHRARRVWLRRHGTPVGLDLHDTHKGNFMVDAHGALRYVDEEGLGYTVRGMGLAKLLAKPGVRPYSPKREDEWEAFRRGYAEVADASFLTRDYCDYVRLLELVRSLEFKLRRETRLFKVAAEVEELRELVGRVKPEGEPADPSVAPARGPGAP